MSHGPTLIRRGAMTNKRKTAGDRVLVLGAGYGGLMAALRAADEADVTVIDPAAHFSERVREHEVAAGRDDISHPLSSFLEKKRIRHVAARVTDIDPVRKEVVTDDRRRHPYDLLVYALGSRTQTFGDGSTEDGRLFTSETARYLRKRLDDGPGTLTVVGGGATGVEMASELAEAERAWKISMVTAGEVGPALSEKGRTHVRSTFRDLGISLEEGRPAAPEDLDADVIVWTASLRANAEIARSAGLALTVDGRIQVDAMLRSVSHPDIYVVGDAAAARTAAAGELRMACATALPLGSRAGRNIVAELRGKRPKPLSFRYYAQVMSLGRRNGLVQFVGADDKPKDLIVTGRKAALLKEQVVRSTVRSLRLAAR
ncbi:FAD-dependent oxidoreductase [Pseudonocardia alaniniphila]